MSLVMRFLTSSIGRKALMALTGLLLIGFLAVHLEGNLLMFAGAHSFNEHGEVLTSNPLIYIAELGLLLFFAGHFIAGLVVTLNNWAARPQGYAKKEAAGHTSHKSLASTSMIVTGITLLVFVPVHLVTFKFGPYYATATTPPMRDLYRLMIEVFQNPLHVGFYVAVMAVIGFHLWHGFGSAFESFGVSYRAPLRRLGQAIAVVVAGGFAIVPIVIYFTGGKL